MTATKPRTYQIAYQRLWFDYDLRDGSYSPKQLRAAPMRVQHDDTVLRYALTWPGGVTEPARREENPIVQNERLHKWKQWRKEWAAKKEK